MNDTVNAFPSSSTEIDPSQFSQKRLLIILIAGIFIAEVLAMIVIYFINPQQYWIETLLDASIMTVLIFPILYYFHFRPLFIQNTERTWSEMLLTKVLENLPVGVWIVDPNGKILHGNPASLKIWAGAKYVGMDQYGEYKAWKLETGELVEPGEWGATRAIQHGETILEEELEIECFDGSHKIILHSATPVQDKNVNQGAIVVNQDITERKRAEQALAKSEALFKTAFQILPVGVWVTDEHGKIIFGNPAGQQIWAGAKYVGIEQFGEYKAWWLNTGQQVTADDWAVARAINKGETSLNEELEIECFDGSHKIILNSAIPVRDDQGQIHEVFVVNQDITRSKQYEQALIQSKELIQKAFDSIDILVAYMDRDFNFIQVNEAYARSGGHPPDFFPGKNHFELYPHAENQAIFQRVVETGETYSVNEKPFEYPEFPERGVTYWNWRLQPVQNAGGSVTGVVLSLVDVTERTHDKLLLERQNRDLFNLSLAEGGQRQLAESLVQSMLALNASLELQDVLKSILEQIQRSIPYDCANIVLIDDNSLRIVHHLDRIGNSECVAAVDKPYLLADFPFVKEICTARQPLLLEDTSNEQQQELIPGMLPLRSLLAVPLILRERVMGIINLTTHQPGVYSQEAARQLMAFATPAALAIDNARLYTVALQARQVAETLNAFSLALTQTLSFEKVMNILLEYVCHLVPSERSYIAVFEDETNMALQAMRTCDNGSSSIQTSDISFNDAEKPYLLEVISTRKSLLIPDVQEYLGQNLLIKGKNMRCWLGIPIVLGAEAIGVLVLANPLLNYFTEEHVRLSELIVSQAAVAVQNAWLFEQVRAGHERFQSLSRRLLEVQENERRYIARELHDEASQTLTALMFGLRQMEQEVHRSEDILPHLGKLKEMTDQVLKDLHHLAIGLRPASLDYLGLVDALGQLAKDSSERYNLIIRFKTIQFPKDMRLPDIVESNIYRIVQEALTNAIRHAEAKNIDVILEYRDEKVIIIIEDDGVSFDTAQVPKSGHLGLLGMQERAQILSGTLQIESIKGRGTTILLEIPYAHSNINR